MSDQAIIDEMVIGWEGLVDENGTPIDHDDPDRRTAALDAGFLFQAIGETVQDELMPQWIGGSETEKTYWRRSLVGKGCGRRVPSGPPPLNRAVSEVFAHTHRS